MNDKLTRQVEEMKKQTIGVEVEMNNIDRSPREGSKPCRRVLWNRQTSVHRKTQRLRNLERLGCRRQRMEIPEGCQHRRTRQPKVRTGHPDPYLRRH